MSNIAIKLRSRGKENSDGSECEDIEIFEVGIDLNTNILAFREKINCCEDIPKFSPWKSEEEALKFILGSTPVPTSTRHALVLVIKLLPNLDPINVDREGVYNYTKE